MKKYEENVAQLIRRLVNGDYFTAKGAACAIIPGVFPRNSDFLSFSKLIL